jgi:hypothetical protein
MSQFAPKLDAKHDEKAPLKREEKVVILSEKNISKEDLRELHRNSTVCSFDAEIQFDSNINNLLEKFDVLIIDVRLKKDLHWYQLMRSAIEKRDDVNVVYLHQKGVPITTRDHLKNNLAVDYIVKELPQKGDYLDKADFFFKLLSDHIPLQRNWFAVLKNLCSCVISCVKDDDEEKNKKK